MKLRKFKNIDNELILFKQNIVINIKWNNNFISFYIYIFCRKLKKLWVTKQNNITIDIKKFSFFKIIKIEK